MLMDMQSHGSVSDVILDRLATNSRPGDRSDDHRVALAVEGGGMRGVVSAGMLLGLEQLGMRDCFDLIVGTSAGAIASAFFVSGQATQGSVLYYEELRRPPFLDTRRLIRLRPALDLDYLVDVACIQRGLDVGAVAAHPIEVHATLTAVDPDNPIRTASLRGPGDRVRAVMKATASLPVLAGPSKHVDGDEYVDGGLIEQVPWRAAVDLGATHLLVLPSKPVRGDRAQSAVSFVERHTVGRVVASMHGSHIARTLEFLPARATAESWALRSIADGTGEALTSDIGPWHGELEIVELPPELILPRRLEDRRPILIDAMLAGAQAVLDYFGLGGFSVEQRVVLNHPTASVGQYRSDALADIVIDRHQSADRAESTRE